KDARHNASFLPRYGMGRMVGCSRRVTGGTGSSAHSAWWPDVWQHDRGFEGAGKHSRKNGPTPHRLHHVRGTRRQPAQLRDSHRAARSLGRQLDFVAAVAANWFTTLFPATLPTVVLKSGWEKLGAPCGCVL